MGKRKHDEISPTAVNFAGPLGQRLVNHAHSRLTHFFYFLFSVSALCKRIDDLDGGKTNPADIVKPIATHQIGVGFKSTRIEHRAFDKKATGLVYQNSSDFSQMDAAHFCNLGFDEHYQSSIYSRIMAQHNDALAIRLYEHIKKFAGDTQLLPKRINIGPDRIIDQLHGVLAKRFLTASRTPVTGVPMPVVTSALIATYLAEALIVMSDYRDQLERSGDDGLVECVDCYISVYNPMGPVLRSGDSNETAHAHLRGAIWGECAASNGALNYNHYLS
jgi:hypothetical protein